MKNIIGLLVFVYVSIWCTECCDEKACPNYAITSHYRDLKCTPILGPDNCCPVSYDCTLFEKIKTNKGKCYFDDKEYGHREPIPIEKTGGSCRASCFCLASKFAPAEITCAHIDCPEFLGARPKAGCYFTYELDRCCRVDEICPGMDAGSKSSIKTCEVEGKTYKEGQKVWPESDTCSKCLCKDGKLECKNINCGTEYQAANLAFLNAAMKYYGKNRCCPIGTVESSDKDEVISKGTTSEAKCKFGKHELNINDEVKTIESSSCVKCSCIVPPLVTCIQEPDCDD